MKTWKKALGLVLALACLTILSGGGLAESKSVMCDGVTLTGDPLKENVDYTFDKDTHLLTIKTAGEYTLSGTAKDQNFRVKVGEKASRIQTTLTIDNLTINTYIKEDEEHAPQGYSPLDFSDAGATTLILVGKNHLTARAQNPAVFAPKVEKDGDLVDQLTIGGEGSLVAQGGYAWPGIGNTGSAKIRIEGGNITAKGGEAAAGIGGSWGHWFDSIVITGGRVVATGGAWANNDIGCGYAPSQKPNHGTNREHVISIEGGVVEANSIFEDTNENTLKKTGGILVQNGAYTVLGDTKLTTNLTILEGKTLTVPSGKTITIEKNGKLEIEKGAQLYVDGTVDGNITGAGKIYYKLNYDLDGGEWKNGYKPEDYYLSGAEFDLPTEENLKKAGYTLSGWTEKGKKDVVWKIPATATGIKNVVAQWTANKYKVSFNANGGTVTPDTMTLTHGDVYGKLPTPTRDGYTFAGWFTDPNGGAKVEQGDVVTASHTLYAHWTAKTCTVTFNANGGTVTPAEQTVTYGSTYGELPTLTREGYTFAGWFTKKDGGTQVTKETVVTTVADHTLYAHWTAKTCTVTFDVNGGTVTPAEQTVTYGSTYGELPTPTREGYTFAGWFTEQNGGTQVTKETVVKTVADHTLYAHWTANTYTVKFDANEGTVTSAEQTVTYGSHYGELPTPTREGYTFAGWFTEQNGGTQVTKETVVKTVADHTLYAHWTANTYTVKFDANEGTVTSAEQTVTYGSHYGELPTPTREGYTFAGWFTEQNGGTKVMADTKVTTAENHTLYAYWMQNIYDVSFDANGGKEAYEPKKVRHGDVYGTFPLTPTRTGYEFAGWYTEKDGGAKVELGDVVTGSHTLYAHWTANKYTVTFNANGGTVTPADAEMTVTYGNPYGKLPEPTRKGYTFVGWFTNPNGGTQVKEDAKVTTAADRTLHAHWTQNIHTVTIKDDKDGKVIESQQIPEGGLAKKPAKEPVREGYTFVGWQANGAAWDFDQNVVERDTEIIALWEKVVIAPDVAIEGGTSFIVGRATENAMVTIGHNVPGFGVANLAYVDVDGKKLNEKDYDAKTGSIKLNVHAAYLNTLSVGEHTLTAHLKGDGYDGQKVSAKLTISPVPDASGLPKTGDASAPMVWCALGLACLAGLAAMKRRK